MQLYASSRIYTAQFKINLCKNMSAVLTNYLYQKPVPGHLKLGQYHTAAAARYNAYNVAFSIITSNHTPLALASSVVSPTSPYPSPPPSASLTCASPCSSTSATDTLHQALTSKIICQQLILNVLTHYICTRWYYIQRTEHRMITCATYLHLNLS